jgi:hypothetical protein
MREGLFITHMTGKWTKALLLVLVFLFAFCLPAQPNEVMGYSGPEHALNHDLFSLLKECDANLTACDASVEKITMLSAKIANEHAALLLHDRALDIFDDILYFMQGEHIAGKRAAHILSVLSFAQGRTVQVGCEDWLMPYRTFQLTLLRGYAGGTVLVNFCSERPFSAKDNSCAGGTYRSRGVCWTEPSRPLLGLVEGAF